MRTYTKEQIKDILESHKLWLEGKSGNRTDLSYADLRGADLRGTSGNMDQLKSIFIDQYQIAYTSEVLQIGCKRYKINDWFGFNDKKIIDMDGKRALRFWRKYKELIKMTIELSPANPTKKG